MPEIIKIKYLVYYPPNTEKEEIPAITQTKTRQFLQTENSKATDEYK